MKNSGLLFSLLFFVVLSLVSCKNNPKPPPAPIVATVGGDPLFLSDLDQALVEFSKETPLPPKGEALESLKKDLLEQLIETKIFLQEARKEIIVISNEELDQTIKKGKTDYSDSEFNDMLKSKGLTYDNWAQRIKENLIIQKLEEKVTSGSQEPDSEEIKEYYKNHIEDYKLKAGVRIRQILLSTENEATEVRKEIEKGANFAKLATERSISPDKSIGGDLGVLTPEQMPEGFEVTLSLPVGSISPVIKTSYGYHIFKVEGRQKEKIIPLSEEKSKIKEILIQEKRDKLFAKWAHDLRSTTEIKINPNLLKENKT